MLLDPFHNKIKEMERVFSINFVWDNYCIVKKENTLSTQGIYQVQTNDCISELSQSWVKAWYVRNGGWRKYISNFRWNWNAQEISFWKLHDIVPLEGAMLSLLPQLLFQLMFSSVLFPFFSWPVLPSHWSTANILAIAFLLHSGVAQAHACSDTIIN